MSAVTRLVEWSIDGGELDGRSGSVEEIYPGEWAQPKKAWWQQVGQVLNSPSLASEEELNEYLTACGSEMSTIESETEYVG